jgi:organic radical activating enzyme
MLVTPHTLSLIVTHRCTAACDHCCFSCSPDVLDHIPIPTLYRLVDEASEISTLKVVVFTGGECFLLGSELDNLVKKANGHGFFTRFVSNGYWAINPNAARRRLQKLVDAGLTEANFSTGDQHAAYVKPEYVKNGAVAAADMGITTIVTIELFQESVFPLEEFLADPDLKRHMEAGTLALKLAPWMKFKGKSALSFTKKYLELVDQARTPEAGCYTALKVLAISPRMQLFACCGLPVEDIEEMHIGSLKNASIKEVLSRTPDDFIKIWVHLHGPDAVIRYAQRFDPSIPFPKDAAHICDACRFMYHDKRIKKIVMDNPPPNVTEIMNVYFQSLLIPTRDMKHSEAVQYARFGDSALKIRATHAMATSACSGR